MKTKLCAATSILSVILLLFLGYVATETFSVPSSLPAGTVAYSDFIARVENDKVVDALIEGRTVTFHNDQGLLASTILPEGSNIADKLIAHHVKTGVMAASNGGAIAMILAWLPWIAVILLYLYIARQQTRMANTLERLEKRFAEKEKTS